MNYFFTSDTHFYHRNIAGPKVSSWAAGYRNFDDEEQMTEVLVKNWNDKIGPNDTVYHVGDVSFGDVLRTNKVLYRLNGHIHLCIGNHEKPVLSSTSNKQRFTTIQDVKSIKVGNQRIFLSHYAHRVWDKSHHGVWHLYGHSHGSLPDDPNSMSFDVGVDCHDYKPLSFEEVAIIMSKKTFKPIDHHG